MWGLASKIEDSRGALIVHLKDLECRPVLRDVILNHEF